MAAAIWALLVGEFAFTARRSLRAGRMEPADAWLGLAANSAAALVLPRTVHMGDNDNWRTWSYGTALTLIQSSPVPLRARRSRALATAVAAAAIWAGQRLPGHRSVRTNAQLVEETLVLAGHQALFSYLVRISRGFALALNEARTEAVNQADRLVREQERRRTRMLLESGVLQALDAIASTDPRDETLRRTCAAQSARLRRLLRTETDTDSWPHALVEILEETVERAAAKGVQIEFVMSDIRPHDRGRSLAALGRELDGAVELIAARSTGARAVLFAEEDPSGLRVTLHSSSRVDDGGTAPVRESDHGVSRRVLHGEGTTVEILVPV